VLNNAFDADNGIGGRLWPGVKCGSADVRILNMQNADVAADESPHFTHTRKPV